MSSIIDTPSNIDIPSEPRRVSFERPEDLVDFIKTNPSSNKVYAIVKMAIDEHPDWSHNNDVREWALKHLTDNEWNAMLTGRNVNIADRTGGIRRRIVDELASV